MPEMTETTRERRPPAPDSEYQTPDQVAQMLGFNSPWAIYRALKKGTLRGVRCGPKGTIRIRKADLEAWLRPVKEDSEASALLTPHEPGSNS